MKSLFDENYRYTPDGSALDGQTSDKLKALFDQYLEYGYSPREIAHVMDSAVNMLELEAVLNKDPEKTIN